MTLCAVFVPRIMHRCVGNEQLTAVWEAFAWSINPFFFPSVKFSLKACSCPCFHLLTPRRATVPKAFESSRTWGSLWLQTMPSLMSSRVFTLWNQAAPPDGSPVSPGCPCASLSTPTGGGKQARDPHLSRKRENIQLWSSSPRPSYARTTKESLTVNRAVRGRRDESLEHTANKEHT